MSVNKQSARKQLMTSQCFILAIFLDPARLPRFPVRHKSVNMKNSRLLDLKNQAPPASQIGLSLMLDKCFYSVTLLITKVLEQESTVPFISAGFPVSGQIVFDAF